MSISEYELMERALDPNGGHEVEEGLGDHGGDQDIVKGPAARDDERFVCVGRTDDPFEADLLTNAVEELGISVIARASRDAPLDPLVDPGRACWDIFVPEEHAARATALLEKESEALAARSAEAAQAAEQEEAATEVEPEVHH